MADDSSSSEGEDRAPVAAFRPPDLAQLLQQADDDSSDEEEGQPPAAEPAAADETALAHTRSSHTEETTSASPSKKRSRAEPHAEATHAADPPSPELRRPAALPPPDLDDVPSLPPPGLDEVPASTGGAPKRVRQFEHVDGQFATHVYLPVAAGASLRRDIDSHAAWLMAPPGGRAAADARDAS